MNQEQLNQVIKDSKGRITVPDLELLQRCCDYNQARKILEIGSADGGSSVVLAAKAKERAGHLYCIEPKPRQKMIDNMIKYNVQYCYSLIRKASPWIEQWLIPDNLDLFFIDGCHQVRWTLTDYHYFEPKVRAGGVIIFHDYGGGCAEDKRCAGYGQPGYVGLVKGAVDIILETDKDKLKEIGRSDAPSGGAIAFEKL